MYCIDVPPAAAVVRLYIYVYENSDKVLSVFDGALQKAAVSSLTDRTTTLIEQGLIEVSRRRICATPWSINLDVGVLCGEVAAPSPRR